MILRFIVLENESIKPVWTLWIWLERCILLLFARLQCQTMSRWRLQSKRWHRTLRHTCPYYCWSHACRPSAWCPCLSLLFCSSHLKKWLQDASPVSPYQQVLNQPEADRLSRHSKVVGNKARGLGFSERFKFWKLEFDSSGLLGTTRRSHMALLKGNRMSLVPLWTVRVPE